MPVVKRAITLYCVEGWNEHLLFEGVRLADLLALAKPKKGVRFIIFYAADGYSSSLSYDYAARRDIMLAARINGRVLDAKRGQFFIAAYQRRKSRWEKVLADSLMSVSQFLDWAGGCAKPLRLLGEGLVYYKEKFAAEGIEFLPEKYWVPTAKKVHLLGWERALAGKFADAKTLEPNYLRLPDVGEKVAFS